MNPLYPKDEMLNKLDDLPEKLDNKKIEYEAICGFDYRVLDEEIVELLQRKNFVNPRIAWDESIKYQYQIKDTIEILKDVGYKAEDIGVFMLVNHEISYDECLRKLDILKIWGTRICDCCYDGGYRNAVPEHWNGEEIRKFRRKSRKHNQLIRFKADPEIEVVSKDQTKIEGSEKNNFQKAVEK